MSLPARLARSTAAPLLAVWLCYGALPPAAFAAAGPTRGATVEGITEYTYPNGLRVLLFPDPTKPTVTVNLTVFVGSRHEGYGETGMAHLLEHLMFKGSPKTPNPPQALSERGARANGTTWFDRTNYYETLNATPQNLEWAIRFEADRMVNSHILAKDLASEMTVVRNEFEMGENDPLQVLEERTLSTAYLWHNYGNSTIGARADIENVPIERLQAFYKAFYRPDNAMLVVAGRFDEQQALKIISDSFGRLAKPKAPLRTTYTQEPIQDGERQVTLRRVGGVQGLVAGYHIPWGAHEDFAALDVLSDVLGDTPSGRLFTALVETKKATQVSSTAYQLREPGVLLFSAELPKESPLAETQALFLQTVEGVREKPPTDEEVARAREGLLKETELLLNASDKVGLALSEAAASGDWRLLFIHRDRLRKVTSQDVLRVAQAYLKPSNRTLGVFLPTEKPDRAVLPPAPDVQALVKDYKGDPALTQGEAFEATPANIEKRTVRTQLPGGMELALLAKENRGDTVFGTVSLRMGTQESLGGQALAGELCAKMLMRGTTQKNRQALQDKLDQLRARLRVSGGPEFVTASFEAKRPQLAELTALTAEVLRQPAFDPKEFEQLRQEEIADTEADKLEPNSVAMVAYQRHQQPYPPSHPNYTMTHDERLAALKAIQLEDVKTFHKRFYGAQDTDLAVVGDFELQAVREQVRTLFDGWKAPERFARVPKLVHDANPVNLTLKTPDKANAFFTSGMNFRMRDDDPDYPALLLGNYMLGGGFLSSRLSMRIRQKDGLSYGVGSQLSAHPIDAFGSFLAYAIYAPQNATKLERAFREELASALDQGFTADEVKKAKSGLLESRQVARAQDPQLAAQLAQYLYLRRTLTFDAALEAKLQALTPAQVKDALVRHLVPSKLSAVKAGDFQNPTPTEPVR